MILTRSHAGVGAREIVAFLEGRNIQYVQQLFGLFPSVNDWRDLPEDGKRSLNFNIPDQPNLVIGVVSIIKEITNSCDERTNIFCRTLTDEYYILATNYSVYSRAKLLDKADFCYYTNIIIPESIPLSNYAPCGVRGCVSKLLPRARDGSLHFVRDELVQLARLAE